MAVRPARLADAEEVAALRHALWPDEPLAVRLEETLAYLSGDRDALDVLVAERGGVVTGFIETSLRHDYVNGCESSPVGFIEGLFVRPEMRGGGMGAALVAAAHAWTLARGCRELASDVHLDNEASQAFHRAAGFSETDRLVFFRKGLV